MKPPSDQSTIDYYNQNGKAFFESTVSIDMVSLYAAFLPLLPQNGHILDVGCGSGRDSKAFLGQGYHVTAIDPSPKMVELASEYIGEPVLQQDVQTLTYTEAFDGIWACASLLHVPEASLPEVFQMLAQALKPDGILYVSFKLGTTERMQNGRYFTDLTVERLQDCVRLIPELRIQTTWITADLRTDRDERWINAILKKTIPS